MQHGNNQTQGGLRVPRFIALIVSLIAIAAFFLPYISATEAYRQRIDALGDTADESAYKTVHVSYSDVKDLSMFEYARIYLLGGKEVLGNQQAGVFYGVLFLAIGLFALLILLCALGRKPVLILLFDILMGGAFFLINWDFVSRGIMPSSDRLWGVSYYVYYPCAVAILVCAIWMFVLKRRMKREQPDNIVHG